MSGIVTVDVKAVTLSGRSNMDHTVRVFLSLYPEDALGLALALTDWMDKEGHDRIRQHLNRPEW